MSRMNSAFRAASGILAASIPTIAGAAAGTTGLTLGALSIAAPWIAAGGAVGVAVLWRMMRNMPPNLKPVIFPMIALLPDLKLKEQKPARMPFLQRLLMASAIGLSVTGIGGMTWNAAPPAAGEDGPTIMVMDNGHDSAHQWAARIKSGQIILDRAEKSGMPVTILPTAPPQDGSPVKIIGPMSAQDAREILSGIKPQAWPVDRAAASSALEEFEKKPGTSVVWMRSGNDGNGTDALVEQMKSIGNMSVFHDNPGQTPHLLSRAVSNENNDLNVLVERIDSTRAETLYLKASDHNGHPVQQIDVHLAAGEISATGTFTLPKEIRKTLSRITIEGESGAGATLLLSEDKKKRAVGIVSTGEEESVHPLLQETFYIKTALEGHADILQGDIDSVLRKNPDVLVLTDSAIITKSDQKKINAWVRDGGTLLRFAGPKLAAQEPDDLLSVPLRSGSRNANNPISGTTPPKIVQFDKSSPFNALVAPQDIVITQSVIARPDANLDSRTWARLSDGTPLVTARNDNKGWIVLVHTTPNMEWSNLPVSEVFSDIIKVIVNHGDGGTPPSPDGAPPLQTLDGFGRLKTPHAVVQPLSAQDVKSPQIGPRHPPGFYGTPELRHAYNLAGNIPAPKPISPLPETIRQEIYGADAQPTDQTGWQLAASLGLLLGALLLLQKQSGLYTMRPKGPAPVTGTKGMV